MPLRINFVTPYSGWPPVPDEIHGLRGYRNNTFFLASPRQPTAEAFLLRPKEKALSLHLTGEAVRNGLAVKGICAIQVGRVRACAVRSLRVEQDSITHLSVRGIPNSTREEQAARDVAEYLAAQAVDRPDWQRLP